MFNLTYQPPRVPPWNKGKGWITKISLDTSAYGTHSLPQTIYRQTKNIRAVQLPLGHTEFESAIRYLGIVIESVLNRVMDIE